MDEIIHASFARLLKAIVLDCVIGEAADRELRLKAAVTFFQACDYGLDFGVRVTAREDLDRKSVV